MHVHHRFVKKINLIKYLTDMEVGSVAAYARSIQEERLEAERYLQQLKGKMVAANVSIGVY
jgi:hypothetical protein